MLSGAPSVSYPVGRSRDAARILMVILAAGLAAACVWRYQIHSIGQGSDWRQWVMLAAVAITAVAAWRALRVQAPGELRWDGQCWTLKSGIERGGALTSVHLDLQSLMLVRLTPAHGRAEWLWLERRAAPERWRDLRRALYARAVASRPDSTA